MRAMKDSGIEWIGEIPQNWLTKKLKYCVDLRLEKTADKASSATYIGLEHVSSYTGTLCEDYEAITDFNGDTLDFCEGDVLFGKLRPYLAKAYQAQHGGCCSSEFWVMDPTGIEGKYLLYYVLSHGFISDVDHSTFGVKMPRAEWEYAGNEKIPFPTQQEQLHIAEYLDEKCAEIDALIAAKEKTNELLKERRQSIIYEAVTKGIDPSVPMKDSGVEWIGEIPEGWSVTKIGFLFKTIGSGTTPTSSDGSYYDGEYNWLQTGDLNDSIIETTEKTITDSAIKNYSVLNCYSVGSLVIAMYGATIGKLGIMGVPCYTNQACCVLDDPQNADTKYVYYWLLGYRQVLINLSLGGGQPNISQSIIRSFRVCLPPKNAQEAIAKELDNRVSSLDHIMKQNEKTIQLLKEYRQGLIYEAVTGKIEV